MKETRKAVLLIITRITVSRFHYIDENSSHWEEWAHLLTPHPSPFALLESGSSATQGQATKSVLSNSGQKANTTCTPNTQDRVRLGPSDRAFTTPHPSLLPASLLWTSPHLLGEHAVVVPHQLPTAPAGRSS